MKWYQYCVIIKPEHLEVKPSFLRNQPEISRRRFVSSLLAGGTALSFAPQIVTAAPKAHTAKSNDKLLDELERRACHYFQEAADAKTGLVLDRVRVHGRETRTVASIAATGFGLSAMCIADSRSYLDRKAAKA